MDSIKPRYYNVRCLVTDDRINVFNPNNQNYFYVIYSILYFIIIIITPKIFIITLLA